MLCTQLPPPHTQTDTHARTLLSRRQAAAPPGPLCRPNDQHAYLCVDYHRHELSTLAGYHLPRSQAGERTSGFRRTRCPDRLWCASLVTSYMPWRHRCIPAAAADRQDAPGTISSNPRHSFIASSLLVKQQLFLLPTPFRTRIYPCDTRYSPPTLHAQPINAPYTRAPYSPTHIHALWAPLPTLNLQMPNIDALHMPSTPLTQPSQPYTQYTFLFI